MCYSLIYANIWFEMLEVYVLIWEIKVPNFGKILKDFKTKKKMFNQIILIFSTFF